MSYYQEQVLRLKSAIQVKLDFDINIARLATLCIHNIIQVQEHAK
jgi:hypothetical protein